MNNSPDYPEVMEKSVALSGGDSRIMQFHIGRKPVDPHGFGGQGRDRLVDARTAIAAVGFAGATTHGNEKKLPVRSPLAWK